MSIHSISTGSPARALYRCLLVLLCGMACCGLYAQPPAVQWSRCLGSGFGDYAHAVRQTADGGYIVAGYVNGNGGDVSGYHTSSGELGDAWVVKLSSSGFIQWQRCLGSSSEEKAWDIQQTPDGGYIVAAFTFAGSNGDVSGSKGGMDYWIVKLNSSGTLQWQRCYGGTRNDYAYSVKCTPDGGYVVAGFTESNDGDVTGNRGRRDYWVLKLDAAGGIQWQKTYGGTNDEEAQSIELTPDGGYIVAGYSASSNGDLTGNQGSRDYWVLKLSSTGAIEWQKNLGGSLIDDAWSVKVMADGSCLVAGVSRSNNGDVSGHISPPGGEDFWVVKLSGGGTVLWNKCYGGIANDAAFDLQLTADGGAVVAGYTDSFDGDVTCPARFDDCWVIKISSTGTLQWQKNTGGSTTDQAYHIAVANDGGYVVCGVTISSELYGYHPDIAPSGTAGDFFVYRLGPAAGTPPLLNVSPQNPVLCQGAQLTLTASWQDAGLQPRIQWLKNRLPAAANTASYTAAFQNNDTIICILIADTICGAAPLTTRDTVVVSVTAGAQPTLSISTPATQLCAGTNAVFTAQVTNGAGNATYQWRVNGVVTGSNTPVFSSSTLANGDQVQCSYTTDAACVSPSTVTSNTITMQVSPVVTPSISIISSADSVCVGTAVTFTATAANGGAQPRYRWQVNGVDSGISAPVFSYIPLNNGDVVRCIFEADPALQCATSPAAVSGSIVIKVIAAPSPSVSIAANAAAVCTGTPVSFTATATNAGAAPQYQWLVNSTVSGGNSPSFQAAGLANGDVVSCLLTPAAGVCVTAAIRSNPVVITVWPVPAVTIAPADTLVTPGATVLLRTFISSSITSFTWTPAAALQDAAILRPLTLPMTTTTTFTLQAANQFGCTATATAQVKVITKLYVPNAFTPNGDGRNDLFRFSGTELLRSFDLQVFNRYGQLVFATRNPGQGWDGTYKGLPVNTGNYVYVCSIQENSSSTQQVIRGSILLLR